MRLIRSFCVIFALMMALTLPTLAQETEWSGYADMPVDKTSATIKTVGPTNFLGAYPLTAFVPVGLEHDGAGNMFMTDIGNSTLSRINTTGGVLGTITSSLLGNPIGVTTDGSFFYITETSSDTVQIYDITGTSVGNFPVWAYTSFPEGITYCPNNGHLYVVNGSGGNIVIEYLPNGTFVATYGILGSSPDGIAWDPLRQCFWIYDSGTDTVRQYDTSFNQVSSFPGTNAAGYSNGEGLAVIGNSLFIVATSSVAMVEFDISGAPVLTDALWCIQSRDGSQTFSFNIETGDFWYVNDNGTLFGSGSIRAVACALMINGMAYDGSMVMASINLCQQPRGTVIVRSGGFDGFGAPTWGGFIINADVNFEGCVPE